MNILDWNALDVQSRAEALERPNKRAAPEVLGGAAAIVDQVRSGGWEALCILARRLDGEEPRLVDVEPIARAARAESDPQTLAALELAARNIRIFHEATVPQDVSVETAPGLHVRKLWRAIDRVGIYVPGGKTPLFSTLMMLAIPAKVAGVREIVTVTPPRSEGGLDPVIALAAELCGIDQIWTVGGAQAVASLAFGAGAIGKVDKICGPGNSWVAEAKRLVSSLPGGPAIDLPAGPSELMVIADAGADADLIARDLLAQAEHDPAAQVLLVTVSAVLASEVKDSLELQLAKLPRQSIARASLDCARLILASDLDEAADIANAYAPEHLSLAVAEPEQLLLKIRNAGAVFAGALAAETFGDYLAGSSHVLPTDGAARAWGGVSVYTFLKAMSVQSVTPAAAREIAHAAGVLARLEALEAHARAADARLERAK